MMPFWENRPALSGALLTVLTLFGGLFVGLIAGTIVFHILPGSSVENPRGSHMAIAATPAFLGFLAGSAAWGYAIAGLARARNRVRTAIAGMLGFAPITITLALLLQALESIIFARYGGLLPMHRLFTLLFVPSAFLIGGISAGAIGIGLGDRSLAWRLFFSVGATSALAFLAVNLFMESMGWVVGGPGAAERLTMVTVMFLGNLGAALVGGAVLGRMVSAGSTETFSVDVKNPSATSLGET